MNDVLLSIDNKQNSKLHVIPIILDSKLQGKIALFYSFVQNDKNSRSVEDPPQRKELEDVSEVLSKTVIIQIV